jgi:hypothetical protein
MNLERFRVSALMLVSVLMAAGCSAGADGQASRAAAASASDAARDRAAAAVILAQAQAVASAAADEASAKQAADKAAADAAAKAKAAADKAAADAAAKAAAEKAAADTAAKAAGLKAQGLVDVAWIMNSDLKPWPSTCDGMRISYQVQVRNGASEVTALAPLTGGRVTKRTVENDILDMTCLMRYAVTAPLTPILTFTLVEKGKPDVALDQAQLTSAEVLAKGAPHLHRVECFGC